jgi:hypothetical protein
MREQQPPLPGWILHFWEPDQKITIIQNQWKQETVAVDC